VSEKNGTERQKELKSFTSG